MGWSTKDQIFTISRIVVKTIAKKKKVHVWVIDLERELKKRCVEGIRKCNWQKHHKINVSKKTENTTVKAHNEESEKFIIR